MPTLHIYATSPDLHSPLMQHPTQPYQDSSDCEKRGCLLVTVIQFTPCLLRPLPSKGVCHPWGVFRRGAFTIKRPLPSKDLYHRCAIAIQGHLSSNGLWLQSAFAFEVSFSSCERSTCNASNYSITLSAATSSDLDSLLMQHPPTQP